MNNKKLSEMAQSDTVEEYNIDQAKQQQIKLLEKLVNEIEVIGYVGYETVCFKQKVVDIINAKIKEIKNGTD